MNGGFLVIGAGIWVLCQVFGGNALGRLGIIDTSTEAASSAPTGPGLVGGLADLATGRRATGTRPPIRKAGPT